MSVTFTTPAEALVALLPDAIPWAGGASLEADQALVLADALDDCGAAEVGEAIRDFVDGRPHLRLLAGHVFRILPTDDAELEGVGFHGSDAPPTSAEYLMEGRQRGGYLVLAGVTAFEAPRASSTGCWLAEDWTAEAVTLPAGDRDSDGTWSYVCLGTLADGRQTFLGWC